MLKRIFSMGTVLAAGAVCMLAMPARSLADGKMVAAGDMQFAQTAAMGGMTEVKLSKLAVKHVTDPGLKSFAQKMVEDHGKANDELKAAAKAKEIELASKLDDTHQAKVDDLSKLSGKDFDMAYAMDMLDDHEKTVELFQKEADSGQDADLKAWAAKMLPTLKEHLQMIKEMHDKMM